MRARLLALASLVSLTFSTPAFAGDAACFWRAAPDAARQTFLAKAQNGMPGEDDFTTFAKAVSSDAILAQCGVKDATGDGAAQALDGFLVQMAATQWLETLKAATAARLDVAWTSMDPALRQRIIDGAATRAPVDRAALADFLKHADLSDGDLSGPAGPALIAYVTGRGHRALGETKF
jgi:hypothetical protein